MKGKVYYKDDNVTVTDISITCNHVTLPIDKVDHCRIHFRVNSFLFALICFISSAIIFVYVIAKRQKAEKELGKVERKYHMLTEFSGDMISRLSLDELKHLYVSPSSETLLGLRPEEVIERSLYEMLHPDDIGALKDFHTAATKLPHPKLAVSYRLKNKDGEFIWVETSCNAASRGRLKEGIIAVTREITERKKLEDLLKKAEESLRLFEENSGSLILLLSPDSKVLRASASSKRILGYPPAKLEGSDLRKIAHKDDHEIIDKILESHFLHQKKKHSLRVKRKNGKFVWVEATLSMAKDFDYCGAGSMICAMRDITKRKEKEEKQKGKLEYNESLFSTATSITAILLSGKTERSLTKSLRIACEAMGVDRVGVFKLHRKTPRGKLLTSQVYGWDSKEAELISAKKLRDLPFGANRRWIGTFERRDCVKRSLKNVPFREKTFSLSLGALSILAAPVFVEKKLWGFICLEASSDERIWKKAEGIFSLSMGNALGSFIKCKEY